MQLLRFEPQDIFILSKTVQFCGKIIPKSKKKVNWIIKQGSSLHYVNCQVSFSSGKKCVIYNGQIVINICDNSPSLSFLVKLKNEQSESAKVQNVSNSNKNCTFHEFQNIYSQPITNAFQKYFKKKQDKK